ncbi:jerky protein homolog-like [Euwallacea similis]|uniref:jerky protein homolog-like n=1 Tax=Euwallacea similis TaxID=1736056 RepID=UPI003450B235
MLKDIDAGASYSSITSKYGIGKATVADIKKNKNKILAYLHENDFGPSNKKTLKFSSNPRVEKASFTWFMQERTKGSPISGEILRAKAQFFYKEITQKDYFKASSGWLHKFKTRFGIRQLSICGESLSSDYDAVVPFVEKLIQLIKEKNLVPHQIYNADESGLFWRVLPKKTLAHFKEKSAPGRKVNKERITFMPCSNSSGSHKLKLLVLNIFAEWFHNKFVPSVRRKMKKLNLSPEAILILDNAPGHPTQLSSNDNNIFALFLPPNCTPLIQPMDQHVIQAIKLFYRKKLLKKIVDSDCDTSESLKSINLKDVVFFLDEAWRYVLNACDSDEEDEIPLARLARQITEPNPTELNNELKEIVDLGRKIDQNLTKEEIKDDSDDVSEIPRLVTSTDAVSAFNTCIAWAKQNNVPEHRMIFLQELLAYVNQMNTCLENMHFHSVFVNPNHSIVRIRPGNVVFGLKRLHFTCTNNLLKVEISKKPTDNIRLPFRVKTVEAEEIVIALFSLVANHDLITFVPIDEP